jgi:hypothetical protein
LPFELLKSIFQDFFWISDVGSGYDDDQQIKPLLAVLFRNRNLKEVVLPGNLFFPEIQKVAASSPDVFVIVETALENKVKIDLSLSKLKYQKYLEVDDILGLQGLECFLQKKGAVG